MAKQITITIETDSLLILRGRSSRSAWCPQCGAAVETLALEGVGVLSTSERTAMEQWLNSGQVHRPQAADGSALICLDSLLAGVQKTKLASRRVPR